MTHPTCAHEWNVALHPFFTFIVMTLVVSRCVSTFVCHKAKVSAYRLSILHFFLPLNILFTDIYLLNNLSLKSKTPLVCFLVFLFSNLIPIFNESLFVFFFSYNVHIFYMYVLISPHLILYSNLFFQNKVDNFH